MQHAKLATIPSHNSYEAVECATKVALVIFYARQGYNKQEIQEFLNFKQLAYEPFSEFNKTCYETLSNCLYVAFTTRNFEEAVRTVISYGGDTDTNGAIVGAMAEALYGVPEYLVREARKKIPQEFAEILDKAYKMA